jgi:hypothetical protein
VAALAVVFGASRYLARPDWTVQLEGGAAAPVASALVSGWVEGEDTRMVIQMTDLQDAPEGFFYEVWLTASDGTHISAGTFNRADRQEFTVAVHRSDYPRIWITKEPEDDDPGPAPETVLDTTMADRASAEKPVANA